MRERNMEKIGIWDIAMVKPDERRPDQRAVRKIRDLVDAPSSVLCVVRPQVVRTRQVLPGVWLTAG
jgi:hypothetical protein